MILKSHAEEGNMVELSDAELAQLIQAYEFSIQSQVGCLKEDDGYLGLEARRCRNTQCIEPEVLDATGMAVSEA